MDCEKFKIRYPEKECTLDQDEEWVTIVTRDSTEKIRLNDYEKFYEFIRDKKLETRDWPYRPDSYILISAGADGVYGTADDITNF